MMNREVFSRTRRTIDNWETPDYFFSLLEKNLLEKKFKFTLDPAASESNAKCKKFYSIKENGLVQNWKDEVAFVNPPFSRIKDWVWKCYKEGQKINTIVVMILPSRTDTQYWHNYIMKAHEIRFCKGRVNFLIDGKKPKNGSTFPLSIIIFKRTENLTPKISSYHHKERERK